MTYKETGFRAFYHQFCVLPITKQVRAALAQFPGAEDKAANGVLTYGYYDREAGLTLEVLGVAKVKGKSAQFEASSKETRSFIRIGAVAEEEFLFLRMKMVSWQSDMPRKLICFIIMMQMRKLKRQERCLS